MNAIYKTRTSLYGNAAQKIASREFNEINLPRMTGEGKKNEETKRRIAINLALMLNEKEPAEVIKSLSNILEYAKNNYFEHIDDIQIKKIIEYATCGKCLKCKINDGNDEENIINPTKFNIDDLQIISELAGKILPLILEQADVFLIFSKCGGFQDLDDSFPDKWVLKSIASIARISRNNRDEVFGFGFFEKFKDILCRTTANSPISIYSFKTCCMLAESLVEFELIYNEQSDIVHIIFPILYDWEEYILKPCFLIAARKLILHIEWFEKYNEKKIQQIFDIFPLLPSNQFEKERSMIPLIYNKINTQYDNEKDEEWFTQSAKYIYEWLFYIGFKLAKTQPLDLNGVWNILISIINANYFREACQIAASAMTLLIKIDVNSFMINHYYSIIIQIFPSSSITVKASLASVIATAFTIVTNEQMLELVNQPNIFDVIFDSLNSIDLDQDFDKEHILPQKQIIPDILSGLYRFIVFCGLYKQGLGAFHNLIIVNTELKDWLDQLVTYSQENNNEELYNQARSLHELIKQRINDYENAMQKNQQM